MTQLSKSSFISQYASGTGAFKNNSTRDITEAVIRTFSQDTADSLMFLLNHAYESFYCTASGTNTYTATTDPAMTAYADKQVFVVKFTNANTGAATLNLNGLGAKSIVKSGSVALSSGDISNNQILELIYDGTNFQIVGGVGDSVPPASTAEVQAGDNVAKYINPSQLAAQTRRADQTGTVISFDYPRTYGRTTPETGNITADYTDAIIGRFEQKIYHEHTSEPTFPSEWTNVGNNQYIPGSLNIIHAEYVRASGVRVEYWIENAFTYQSIFISD